MLYIASYLITAYSNCSANFFCRMRLEVRDQLLLRDTLQRAVRTPALAVGAGVVVSMKGHVVKERLPSKQGHVAVRASELLLRLRLDGQAGRRRPHQKWLGLRWLGLRWLGLRWLGKIGKLQRRQWNVMCSRH